MKVRIDSGQTRATSRTLRELGVAGPALLLDEVRVRRNITRMAARAAEAAVRLRPHAKTHQSAAIARWLAEAGADGIAVSSLPMARYFAEHGWRDITVARLVHPGEAAGLAELARTVGTAPDGGPAIGVPVDDPSLPGALASELGGARLRFWIKVDAGYGRTGVRWDDRQRLSAVARAVRTAGAGPLAGVLTHTGQAYGAAGPDRLSALYDRTVERLSHAARAAADDPRVSGPPLLLSAGDTPTCSAARSLEGTDEIRPGNFVFYDLMQVRLGACEPTDVGVAVACPVLGVYPDRGELVIHGGAVHLSKESLPGPAATPSFGQLALASADGFGQPVPGTWLSTLSQEHGVVGAEPAVFDAALADLRPGDLVLVLPVHSCLTADLYGSYLTMTGRRIERRPGGAS
ncbi:MAG: alanine racemase [Candidatus Krumholzibacteriia bacterium]